MKDMVDLLNERIAELEAEIADLTLRLNRWNSGGNWLKAAIKDRDRKIAELEAENERLSTGVSNCAKTVDQLMTENERLRRERETIPFEVLDMTPDKFIALKKDAERWRKGREKGWIWLGMENEIDAERGEE